mgnify:FL=1
MSKDKIIRASDNSAIKRLVKKYFGIKYLKEITDKELQQMRDQPASVFGKLKNMGKVDGERARRKNLTEKAYKDAILRDFTKVGGKYGSSVGREAREVKANIARLTKDIKISSKTTKKKKK